MKLIPLGSKKYPGKFAQVDDEDYEHLNQWAWYVQYAKNTRSFYVLRSVRKDKKMYKIRMHRVIMGVVDSKLFVDHIDHDTLNNQKSNLRLADLASNNKNRTSAIKSTSKYLGVCWKKGNKKWQAKINVGGKHHYLGIHSDEKEAAIAYNKAAVLHFGEFANLNQL